jgi:crotonobetainyl-CoA:carnitine CoA-transferase CaiB-like acyl-CoA transferase
MNGPLSGVRVVEYAQYVAGPFAGSLLGELGAEVIKVEPPGGDAYRQVMPVAPGIGRFFVPLNRGKRSVVLDLKTPEGLARSRALLSTADIVLHNLRPDRAARFGLDWESLHAQSPRVVAGVVTSFGPEGPLAGAPAYDLVAQARSGLLTAHASPGDVAPVRAGGVPMADLAAGFLLATGVLAALVHARETGEGERVEVPLLAAAFAVQVQDMVWLAGERMDEAARPASRSDLHARAGEIGLGLATNPYYRCYEAADGFLAVACLNLTQRQAFIGLFGLEDSTIEAPDLIPEDADVVAAKRAVTSEIAACISTEPVGAWLARLEAARVPCGPVLARETVHADPQVQANGFLREVEQPGLGAVTMLGRLFRVGSGERGPVGAAPVLGADTAAVLAELDAR